VDAVVLTQVLSHDENVKSIAYNEASGNLIVIFGGGNKSVYKNITQEMFDKLTEGLSVLDLVRHNNLVGVRIR
jgi:hypothetical protein